MTQSTDAMSPAPGSEDPWVEWAAQDGGSSGRRRAAAVLLPLAVLVLLAVGVVLYAFSGDPASAAGSCGGG